LDFRAATPTTFAPPPGFEANQPGVFWTATKWGLVAAAVGYCFYFDRKRRSAPGFKEAHRNKRKAAQQAERKAQEAALAAKKNATIQAQKAAAAMMGGGGGGGGGGGRPQQPKKPPREAILQQAEQYAKQGLQMINEAGDDKMKVNSGLQIILESVNVFNMLEDPQGLVTWCQYQTKVLKENGHHEASQKFESTVRAALQSMP